MIAVLPPGTTLQNRYQIERLLGQGGMGAVYRAWDLRLAGLIVAVKENFDNSPNAQAQFRVEAELLAKLNHAALPRVTDRFIEASGRQYLVMDFIEGNDVEEIVMQRGRMPEPQAIAWISDVLGALEYLHTLPSPIIHRDVKPANIKVRPDGKAVLVDFGIAKVYDASHKTRTGARAVSAGYAPLEQYGMGTTDARTDIYAVGATLYFMLTTRVPPEATELAAGAAALTRPSALGISINPNLERAVMHAMEPAAPNRFQSAREFRQALSGQWRPSTPPVRASPTTYGTTMPAPVGQPNVAAPPYSAGGYQPIPIPQPISAPRPALSNVQYASWGRRFGAFLIDMVLMWVIYLPILFVAAIMDAATGTRSSYSSSSAGVFMTLGQCAWYLIVPAYFISSHAAGGQTVGKKAFGIRVVRIANQRPPNLGWAILRAIAEGIEWSLVLCAVGLIGFLWPLWDVDKQAIHDKIAGTVVIRT